MKVQEIFYKKKKKEFHIVLYTLRAKLNNEWYLSQNTCLVQPFQFFIFLYIFHLFDFILYIWQEHNVWESIASTLAFDEKANRDKIFRCGGFHFIAWDFPFRNLFKPPNRKIQKKNIQLRFIYRSLKPLKKIIRKHVLSHYSRQCL